MKNNNDFLTLFEKRISEYTKAPFVILTDSCTNALFLCLKYLNIKEKNIIIPKRTYISVPQSIYHAGNKPIFKNIKWYGKYQLGNLPIWDCAVNFKPNMYESNQFMCLSFQQKKAIGIGKGGAILTDNKKAYKILKRMAHDGRDSGIPVKDDRNIILGYHMNMIPDDAAKGILLLNQYNFNNKDIKNYKDYPKINKIFSKNIF